MVEEIGPNIFCVKLPLPGMALKELNSYILMADDRSLLIDTGCNDSKCFEALQKAHKLLALDWSRTDIFITHYHMDHLGLLHELAPKINKIYLSRYEAEFIASWEGFKKQSRHIANHGFPKIYVASGSSDQDSGKTSVIFDWVRDIQSLEDGDCIDFGPYHLEFVHTPGHSPGHMCLYESNNQVLFSGDHILADISPIIMCYSDEENPLQLYMDSLEKTRKMEVDMVFPGHRDFIEDHRLAIDDILNHHERRLDEILDIVSDCPRSAYEVASMMKWNIAEDDWVDFPDAQKWFATSEVIAHLRYLEELQRVKRVTENDSVYFQCDKKVL